MSALLNPEISDGAFRDYCRMRALAWGKDVVEFTDRAFQEQFGISPRSLYRHLSELATNAELRFSSTSNSITAVRQYRVEFLHQDDLQSGDIAKDDNIAKNGNTKVGNTLLLLPLNDQSNNLKVEEDIAKNGNIAKFDNETDFVDFDVNGPEFVAERVLVSVTAGKLMMLPASNQREAAIKVIGLYFEKCGKDDAATVAALLPFWEAWRDYRTKEGLPASLSNLAWLTEWAVAGEVPANAKAKGKAREAKKTQAVGMDDRKKAAAALKELV